MLARKSKIFHPLGFSIETPLLVPSFSSKGFGFGKKGDSGNAEVADILEIASEFLTETMLVSAFDIAYNQISALDSAITELTFVDSGGYEISDFHDLSAVYAFPVNNHEWSVEKLHEVYSEWPDHIPSVLVSYDNQKERLALNDQIQQATELFDQFPKQLNNFLVKPENGDCPIIDIDNLISKCTKLQKFDIIGLTEKEIGESILDRMTNVAKVRIALDERSIRAPLHIFGSLDPISSILYFLSGAEIFDGLTWLRFGYSNGAAQYWGNYGAQEVGIDRSDDFVRVKTMQENLSYLRILRNDMQKFLLDNDFSKFSHNAHFFSQCFDLLRTKEPRI